MELRTLWGESQPKTWGRETGRQPDTCGRGIFSCWRSLLVQRAWVLATSGKV